MSSGGRESGSPSDSNGPPPGRLVRWFRLDEAGTRVRTEILGGLTTFLTMAYIVVVNPAILAQAGVPHEGALFATCVSAAVATLVMGLWARYPIALAPGMGLNAYFAFVAVRIFRERGLEGDLAWQAALGAVFLSGVAFLILSLFRIRAAIVDAVPRSLKNGIAAGIGLFIAFIGLQNAGIVVADEQTLVRLGEVSTAPALAGLVGILVAGGLYARKWRGALLAGIGVAFAVLVLMGGAEPPEALMAWPDPSETFLALRPLAALEAGLFTVLFVFLFVDLFDTVGTLIAVGEQGRFTRDDGTLPRASRALQADAIGTVVGSLLGTSTVTSYIESMAGIATGARTGLAALPVALLLVACLFFSPLVAAVPAAATTPALVMVGALMMGALARIEWSDPTEAIPAFLVFAVIPLSFSISDGIALGFVAWPALKAMAGRGREVTPLVWVLAAVFLLRWVLALG